MPYTPPAGSNVGLGFAPGPYTPPAGSNVPLEFVSVGATNTITFVTVGNTLAMGTPTIGRGAQIVNLAGQGFDSQRFGQIRFGYPFTQSLVDVTLGSPRNLYGLVRVYDPLQEVDPSGIAPGGFGTADVGFYYRFVYPTSSAPRNAYGNAFVAYKLRRLNPLEITPGEVGRPTVDFRRIRPAGIDSMNVGLLAAQNRRAYLLPEAIRSTAFVSTQHVVRYRTSFIALANNGIAPPDVSRGALVFNKNRRLQHFQDTQSLEFGRAAIANRNRVLGPSSWRSHFVSFYLSLRRTPSFDPVGINSAAYGTPRVEYRIRRVYPEPWVSEILGPWNQVWNSARVVSPTGRPSTAAYGTPALANRNRRVYPQAVDSLVGPSAALVAFRIRTLSQFFGYASPEFDRPQAQYHDVRLNPYPIKPTGFDSFAPAAHYVEGRRNIIAPAAIYLRDDAVSMPYVVNRNRSLGPYYTGETSYGRPVVTFRIRRVYPDGFFSQAIGKPVVADSRIYASMSSASSGSNVGNHTVAYTSITPFITRYLYVGPYRKNEPPENQVGPPVFRTNTIFAEGWSSMSLPHPTVRANSILVPTIQTGREEELYFGIPAFTAVQYLEPTSISPSIPSRARLSPYTIYAASTTEQAEINHPPHKWRIVDLDTKWENGTGWRGSEDTTVMLKNRRIYPTGVAPGLTADQPGKFGVPFVSLKIRRVFVQSWRSSRMGQLHDIPTTPRVVEVYDPFEGEGVGEDTVVDFPAPGSDGRVRPVGFSSSLIGAQQVELKHRRIYPSSAAMPDSEEVPPPIYVGPPVPVVTSGASSMEFGNPMVAYRIRTSAMNGWDSMDFVTSASRKAEHMRVYNKTQIVLVTPPAAQTISAQGSDYLAVSFSTVYNRKRFVSPDCICEVGMPVPSISRA
jgi:hypothetical protein